MNDITIPDILTPPSIKFKDHINIQGYIPTINQEIKPSTSEVTPEVTPMPQQEIKSSNVTFNNAFDQVIKEDPSAAKYRNVLTKIAEKESNFQQKVQNKAGAPAWGYFQFMQGTANGKTWNNIKQFAGVDVETFLNDPVLQIKAAVKLAKANENGFNEKDKKRAKELNLSDSALIGAAWLGGVGGTRRYLHSGENISDKHWDTKTKDPKKKAGVDMIEQLSRFNNIKMGRKGFKFNPDLLKKDIHLFINFK